MSTAVALTLWWAHAASAVVWIGGIFFMVVIAMPAAFGSGEGGPKALGAMGRRFSPAADASIVLLVFTGALMFISGTGLRAPSAFQLLKIAAASSMIAVHYYRGKGIPLQAARAEGAAKARLQRLSANLARLNLGLGFIIILVSGVLVK